MSDDGVVTGVKAGKAKITATAAGTKKNAAVTVNVVSGAVGNGLEIEYEDEEAPAEAE